MRRLEQVAAGVRVSEASDAQAVRGIQLAEEELTTGVPHPVELEEARCWEQRLRTVQTQKAMFNYLIYHFRVFMGEKRSRFKFIYSTLPARCLRPLQSLRCKRTEPTAPKPGDQCHEGSHGSVDSQTSHLQNHTDQEKIFFFFPSAS